MITPRTLLLTVLICYLSCFFCEAARHRPTHYHHRKEKTHAPPSPSKSGQNINSTKPNVLNVESFGAKADGKTDNYQAFKNAWDTACGSLESYTILVPGGKTYYVKHINFTGPCKSSVSMEIQGTIKAFPRMYDVPRRLWIKFENIRNLDIFGGGTIHGNGDVWWKFSCKIKKTKPCQTQSAPTAMTFQSCTNLRISNLSLVNPPQMHLNIQDSRNVDLSKLTVNAPEDSPNTDGIHITRSTNINILDSIIGTGDDCISIVNGSRNIEVRNIECGPGHGISIGSLGEDNTENHVSDILVKGVKFTGTTNGVRIKTWQGGRGTARNIAFEDILMNNVANPITIDQYYCDKGKNKGCKNQKEAVAVENIVYRNIRGTSASKVALNLNCSQSVPCRNLMLENVSLRPHEDLKHVEAFCSEKMSQVVNRNSFPSCNSKL